MIIATGMFMPLDRHDDVILIAESESSPFWMKLESQSIRCVGTCSSHALEASYFESNSIELVPRV